jgi:hypothetical protein
MPVFTDTAEAEHRVPWRGWLQFLCVVGNWWGSGKHLMTKRAAALLWAGDNSHLTCKIEKKSFRSRRSRIDDT